MKLLPRIGFALVAILTLGACAEGTTEMPASQVGDGGASVFFVTNPEGRTGDQALFRGPLSVENGCVLIGVARDFSLPVWPAGFTSESDSSGRLVVKDADGVTIATEGEVFEMGGGYTAEFRPKDKVEPMHEQLQRVSTWLGQSIPDACVGDVYGVWVVGETEPLSS